MLIEKSVKGSVKRLRAATVTEGDLDAAVRFIGEALRKANKRRAE